MCNAALTTAISEQHQKWVMHHSGFLACLLRKGTTSVDLCHLSAVRRKEPSEKGRGTDNYVPRLQARSKTGMGKSAPAKQGCRNDKCKEGKEEGS